MGIEARFEFSWVRRQSIAFVYLAAHASSIIALRAAAFWRLVCIDFLVAHGLFEVPARVEVQRGPREQLRFYRRGLFAEVL